MRREKGRKRKKEKDDKVQLFKQDVSPSSETAHQTSQFDLFSNLKVAARADPVLSCTINYRNGYLSLKIREIKLLVYGEPENQVEHFSYQEMS